MQIEAFSHPKARDLSVPPDDVLLHVPGRLTALFDGATDATGRQIDGVPIGRLAAMTAARAAADLPSDSINWTADRILSRLSAALADHIPNGSGGAPASTTALIAFEARDRIRLVGLGDTGYRVNGSVAEVRDLPPDQASTPARVALFRHLMGQGHDPETCETTSRRYICLGLDLAVSEGALSSPDRDRIIEAVVASCPASNAGKDIEEFLRGGLQFQYRYANAPGHPLGYGVINGQKPDCTHALDRDVARAGLRSLELFTDGYMIAPAEVSVAAWERAHAELEARDPHRIGDAPACKGSLADRFFDDRSVVILTFA